MVNKKNTDYVLTPLNISPVTPIYNARGHINGFSFDVEYYAGKLFTYTTKEQLLTIGKYDAATWVWNMQLSGYGLLRSPKYLENPENNSLKVYMLCGQTFTFPKHPFGNFRARAWRFWQKMQSECEKVDQNVKDSIYNKLR